MSYLDEKDILRKYTTIDEIERTFQDIKNNTLSDTESFSFLDKLVGEYKKLIQMEDDDSGKLGSQGVKVIRKARSKRRTYIIRVVKQIGFRWWAERDANGGFSNKKYRPRFLKDKLLSHTDEVLTEVHLTNLLWQVRSVHVRKRQELNPRNRLLGLLKNEEGVSSRSEEITLFARGNR